MKLLSGIKKLISRPKPRNIYAATSGEYLGEFLVYIESENDMYCFLSLPDMKVRKLPKDTVTDQIGTKVLDKVERLPRDVFSLCCEQYAQSNKSLEIDEIVPRKRMSDE